MIADASQIDARAKLLELANRSGVSLSKLSALIGRNSSYLQQFVKRGSPRKLEERDRQTLAEYFNVSEEELGGRKEKSYINSSLRDEDFVAVPRLSIAVSGRPGRFTGGETPFDNFGFSGRWLRDNGLDPTMLSSVTVDGDSMEPLLRHGDEVLIDRRPGPWRDGIHVVRVAGALAVKRLARLGRNRVSLLSQNLAYPPVDMEVKDIDVIGRVVWKGGRV
ncbi:S24 family peptidase [Parerythrobacter aestuarii]|uniref:S24 family peptidase n=1 Tax=Parerythrobacter aestuarii TaxID=3020909 RepID=UPI0024DE4A50|nr:S24 family peptidase [Parerythrobacter aestuarii]